MLPLPAGREASAGVRASRYESHHPERTLLYQLVEEHYPALKVHLSAQGSALPAMSSGSSRPTSNAAALNMDFCGFGVRAAMPSTSWRSAVNGAVFAPVVVLRQHGRRLQGCRR